MTDAVIISIIGAVTTCIVGYLTYRGNVKIAELHKDQKKFQETINGHMTKLLETTASDERQKGNVEGRQQLTDESEKIIPK